MKNQLLYSKIESIKPRSAWERGVQSMFAALQAIVSDYEALMRSQGATVNIGSDFTAGEWVGSRLGGHIAKAKSMISKAKGEA